MHLGVEGDDLAELETIVAKVRCHDPKRQRKLVLREGILDRIDVLEEVTRILVQGPDEDLLET